MLNLVLGYVAAFLFALAPGKAVIARLRSLKATQNVSSDAPVSHSAKQGTPTMGGVLILFALTVVTLAYIVLTQIGAHRHIVQDFNLLPLLLMTLAFGAIGALDDYLSLKRGKNLGLRAREKFAAQWIVGALFVFWMYRFMPEGTATLVHLLPDQVTDAWGMASLTVSLGWLYYPIALIFLVGLSNATNFTDGLDGLASGVTIVIAFALAALCWPVHSDLSFFCLALAGALAGFLWWNAHPARVFMGDTASLALGAGLAGAAMLGKHEVGLIVASLVCWAELISVMIQVSVFKYRKRKHGLEYARAHRVFRRTPLHHHFEEAGLPETQVVIRFWLAGIAFAALALLWRR